MLLGLLVLRVRQVLQVLKAIQDLLVQWAQQVLLVLQGPPELKAQLVRQVLQDRQVLKVQLEQRDQ